MGLELSSTSSKQFLFPDFGVRDSILFHLCIIFLFRHLGNEYPVGFPKDRRFILTPRCVSSRLQKPRYHEWYSNEFPLEIEGSWDK